MLKVKVAFFVVVVVVVLIALKKNKPNTYINLCTLATRIFNLKK